MSVRPIVWLRSTKYGDGVAFDAKFWELFPNFYNGSPEQVKDYQDVLSDYGLLAKDFVALSEEKASLERFRDTVLQVLKEFGCDDDEWCMCTANTIQKEIHKRSASASADSL